MAWEQSAGERLGGGEKVGWVVWDAVRRGPARRTRPHCCRSTVRVCTSAKTQQSASIPPKRADSNKVTRYWPRVNKEAPAPARPGTCPSPSRTRRRTAPAGRRCTYINGRVDGRGVGLISASWVSSSAGRCGQKDTTKPQTLISPLIHLYRRAPKRAAPDVVGDGAHHACGSSGEAGGHM